MKTSPHSGVSTKPNGIVMALSFPMTKRVEGFGARVTIVEVTLQAMIALKLVVSDGTIGKSSKL